MGICIIPARGGSKRIPRKNIKDFHGRPMISWSIKAALESNAFERVVVSTDDEEIAEIARAHGADVPFMRPDDLADDHTPTVPVIVDAVQRAEAIWGKQSLVCCLYATAPFVDPETIRTARKLLEEDEHADYAFPVTSFPFPIQRGLRLSKNGRIEMFQPEHALTRSQDLEEAYHDAGQFYWGRKTSWQARKTIMGPGSIPLVVPRYRVQDIDTQEDWVRAERLFTALKKG